MSFFKDFKQDLSQAMNELIPEDFQPEEDFQEQLVNTLETDEAAKASDSERMMELIDELTSEDTPSEEALADASEPEEAAAEADKEDDTAETEDDKVESEDNSTIEIKEEEGDVMDENIDLELLDALNAEEDAESAKEESKEKAPKLKAASISGDDEVTVISKGTTINGSISSEGSLEIMGCINGDIECLGKLSITGKVNGNASAAEVYVNTERMEGSINSEGSVKIGLGTVVIGDITGTSGVIAGAVKGEIDVNGPIVIDSTAIIKGNIKAKSVQINNGAVLEGFCSLSYSEVDVDNIFE
jgi:cytoskeletal protein CcmA (bactofilin family)